MAGLWVGQSYGVFHRPGFGLLGSVPRYQIIDQKQLATIKNIFECLLEETI